MKDPSHPIWPLLRFAIVAIVITTVLFVNASDFDETEAKAITAFLSLYGVSEGAMRLIQHTKQANDQ